jgi:NAD(P)-dependent dehydrogenase (short-subunit alcohol dehydrogenase family)
VESSNPRTSKDLHERTAYRGDHRRHERVRRRSRRPLADDGVHVVTLDITQGADLQLDVTDAAAVRAAAAQVGPIDILINSAGIVGSNASL